MSEREKHAARGVLAGVIGGLVASWVMNQFQAGLSKTMEAVKQKQGGSGQPQQGSEQSSQESEDATQKTAEALAEPLLGHPLTKAEKQTAGPMVHYGFGALMGGIYGGVAEYAEPARLGAGTLFGTVLFLGADEIAVPAFGLSKPPTEQPLSQHLSPWLAHLVYGATVEGVRRLMRSVL